MSEKKKSVEKFTDWKKKKKNQKVEEHEPVDKTKIGKVDGEWEITGINDVIPEENVEKALKEAIIVNADLGNHSVKRGDDIYISCMMRKKNSNWNAPETMGVLKVKVTDIYNTLSILNTIK